MIKKIDAGQSVESLILTNEIDEKKLDKQPESNHKIQDIRDNPIP